MKSSTAYRKAAERIKKGLDHYCCKAIMNVKYGTESHLTDRFVNYFLPLELKLSGACVAWFFPNEYYVIPCDPYVYRTIGWLDFNSLSYSKQQRCIEEMQNHRIMCLLLLADICEWEGD